MTTLCILLHIVLTTLCAMSIALCTFYFDHTLDIEHYSTWTTLCVLKQLKPTKHLHSGPSTTHHLLLLMTSRLIICDHLFAKVKNQHEKKGWRLSRKKCVFRMQTALYFKATCWRRRIWLWSMTHSPSQSSAWWGYWATKRLVVVMYWSPPPDCWGNQFQELLCKMLQETRLSLILLVTMRPTTVHHQQ